VVRRFREKSRKGRSRPRGTRGKGLAAVDRQKMEKYEGEAEVGYLKTLVRNRKEKWNKKVGTRGGGQKKKKKLNGLLSSVQMKKNNDDKRSEPSGLQVTREDNVLA